MKKILIIVVVILLILAGVYLAFFSQIQKFFFRPTEQKATPGISLDQNDNDKPIQENIKIVADNLDIPWEIAWLPSGDMLVTQRPGSLLKIGDNRQIIEIEGVEHVGEGGLQGMVLDPDFEENSHIYLYLTSLKGDSLINRVDRYTLEGNVLNEKMTIIDNLPGAKYHDGGRIEFGPDGKLYITIGDATQENRAQDLNFWAGKILRINKDGSFPEDNPFGNSPIYSYGHRNPQGIAWDSQGTLWATEHGRSGALSGYDELNMIKQGKNYGWPDIQGDEESEGMTKPVIHSGPNTTWAPAGLAYYDGRLFFAGLRGETLYEYDLSSGELKYHFFQEFGRLRAVRLGPDGLLYISTSNTDGRGGQNQNDDKIIRINPEIF